jgi:xanthine dehydrogenase large subunit
VTARKTNHVIEGGGIDGAPGTPLRHESAHLHVSGEARYTDDLPEPAGTLHAAIGTSRLPHARLRSVDLAPVRAAPGVVAVLSAADVPGANDLGGVVRDEPIFADGLVESVGQSIFAVAATSVEAARRATRLAAIDYEELEPLLDVDAAMQHESFVLPSRTLSRGDAGAALAAAPHRLEGRFRLGGQEQFYLEGQIALAVPGDDGDMTVYSSTQHPGEVQLVVAHALGRQAKDVVCICRRMGGAFGGKESQAALYACVAALLADRTGRPVKLRLDRDADMAMTGKRHDYRVDWKVGFDDDGVVRGLDVTLASRCGMSADLSGPVNDRTVFHVDNCYYLDQVTITSHRCKTHTVSNTAFRGFGGPQGMLAIDDVMFVL